MYAASWNVTITPLDTCGTVTLSGPAYLDYMSGVSLVSRTLAQAQLFWSVNGGGGGQSILTSTSIWYDTVAAYMVDSPSLLEFSNIQLLVTSEGYTVVSEQGSPVTAALNWAHYNEDEAAYEDYVADVIGFGYA